MSEKTRILLSGSDFTTLQLVQQTLGSLGYEVIPAGVDDVVNKAKNIRPAVILLDSEIAANDEFKTLRCLKKNSETSAVPVIVMTSHSVAEDRLKALSAGADEFLIKPVDVAELQARVRSLVKVKVYNDSLLNYKEDIEREVAKRTQELTRALEKIKITSLDTVYRLSVAGEYKDEGTGAHVQRVSHYSSAIARRMGLDDKFVENILWAAPMHDIGKIGIPDRILLKPGKLDDEEFTIMKTHTTIGAEILKDASADFIKMAADIALFHHEQVSGKGYPRGLKGPDIPLSARIVAIADQFDAMTTQRPYKPAFPMEKALSELGINRDRGAIDPQVLDSFLSIEDEIRAELNFWNFMATGNPADSADLSNLFS